MSSTALVTATNSAFGLAAGPISAAATAGNWHTGFSTHAHAFATTAPAAKYAYAKRFAGSGSWSQID
jgi:hypothetical protein